MPVKHWSRAGLLLTRWCNARCAACYLSCRPAASDALGLDEALAYWAQLADASPHGCRIHLTGGEPFGDWEALIQLCRQARRAGLGGLEKVETNAFWATDEALCRQRLGELDACGMGKLTISADPFHQAHVPIDRPRRLAAVARDLLGAGRVNVRWADWLEEGFDLLEMSDPRRRAVYADWLARGRDRLLARAAGLGGLLNRRPMEAYAEKPCREPLLRGKHVHVLPGGELLPGTCAGILVGRLGPDTTAAEQWQRLDGDHAERKVLAALVDGGPVALAELAAEGGWSPDPIGYASACQLCWSVRSALWAQGRGGGELGPDWLYEAD